MVKGIGKLFVFGGLGISALLFGSSDAFADIAVKNIHSYDYFSAAVNTYGPGQSDYYTIAPKKTEIWSRSDSKGFLVALDFNTNNRNPQVYYSVPNASYYMQDGFLKMNGGQAKKAINVDENRYEKNSKGEYIYTNVKLPGVSNKVVVKNLGSSTKVAISTWNGGDSSYYNLSKGETESWSRYHDARGYLMNVDGAKYFIHAGEAAIVYESSVYINNKLAMRCDSLDY